MSPLTFLERDQVHRDFQSPLNVRWGRRGDGSCCSACGLFLLSCFHFLHSNCFHMARSVNVIRELPPVISSLSHQGLFCRLLHQPSHPLRGSEEFHTTRWSHHWVFPHTLKTMGLVPHECGLYTRNTRDGFLEVCFPIHVVLMHSCSALVRISLKSVLSKVSCLLLDRVLASRDVLADFWLDAECRLKDVALL